jgi:hypothetical protein
VSGLIALSEDNQPPDGSMESAGIMSSFVVMFLARLNICIPVEYLTAPWIISLAISGGINEDALSLSI